MPHVTVHEALIVNLTFKALTIVLILFRVFTRLRYGRRRLYNSDYFLIATIPAGIFSSFSGNWNAVQLQKAEEMVVEQHLEAKFKHESNLLAVVTLLGPAKWDLFFKGVYVTEVFDAVELWLIKAAFLALYWEVTANVKTRLRKFILVASIFTAASGLAACFVYLFWCHPVSTNWTTNIKDLCLVYAYRGPNVILFSLGISTDILILVIPIVLVKILPFLRRQRFSVLALGLVAIMSMVGTCVRFVEVFINIENKLLTTVMTDMESSMGKIALCLPAFRTLLQHHPMPFQDSISSGWSQVRSLLSMGRSRRGTHGSLEGIETHPELAMKKAPVHSNTIDLLETTGADEEEEEEGRRAVEDVNRHGRVEFS